MVIELFADHLHSLKEKRQLILSLKDRLRNQFNVAVSETDEQDSWQKAQMTVVSVSNSREILENTFRRIEKFLDTHFEMRMVNVSIQFL